MASKNTGHTTAERTRLYGGRGALLRALKRAGCSLDRRAEVSRTEQLDGAAAVW